ncbi:MAG TPA: M50 family metallopeptidase [Baekduia sp.]|nr:M50 family metallopeptidase [Baekduia sp.]
MSYVLAIGGFILLVILHELGHFGAAKAVGMKVERFSLFFPPLLFKVRRGETEYAIGSVPLGGYVRITGMTPQEEIADEDRDRAYYLQPVWKRIFVIAAGPAVNLVLAVVIVFALFAIKGQPNDRVIPNVGTISKNSPASTILKPGDRIVSADGVSGPVEKIRAQIASHRCAGEQRDGCTVTDPVKLVVIRDGVRLGLEARPKYDAEAKRALLGFGYDAERYYTDLSVDQAAKRSIETNWRVTKATVSAIARIFVSSDARKDVSGVVGSVEVTKQSFDFDVTQAIFVLALISLSLGIINLFPFLPLDGGHIFWALAEKLRGRAIPFSVIEKVSVVGFMLVAFLFVVGLTNDIGRLSGEGFNVR